MATATRPRLSREFIQQHQRTRIIDALASCVVEKGYRQTTVADVVREAGIARNTFYDNFSSKEDAAWALLLPFAPTEEEEAPSGSVFVLALDITARLKLGKSADTLVDDAKLLLGKPVDVEPLEPQGTEDDPNLSQLPPGRHGLPREFVAENQRTRLLAGTAQAIYRNGYEATTIESIVAYAAVSRRTFYEHFDGKEAAVHDLVKLAYEGTELLGSGLGSLWVEILAAAFCGDEVASESKRRSALRVVELLAVQLNQGVAA